jgi:hypothetical protein
VRRFENLVDALPRQRRYSASANRPLKTGAKRRSLSESACRPETTTRCLRCAVDRILALANDRTFIRRTSLSRHSARRKPRGGAGGVADEWVTQLLRQGDAKVFKKYSQMKLQTKREALAKLNRLANEAGSGFGTVSQRISEK